MWVGSVTQSFSCLVHSEQAVETTCFVPEIKIKTQNFSNECGLITPNYVYYISTTFNVTNSNGIPTEQISGICATSYCLTSSSDSCLSKSCSVYSDGCGPIVTRDESEYLALNNTFITCWYTEASTDTYDDDDFGFSHEFKYWTFLEAQSCYTWSSIFCFSVSMFFFLCSILLFLYFFISEYRLYILKKNGSADYLFSDKYIDDTELNSDPETFYLLKK